MVLINVKIQRKSERNYNCSLVIRDLTLKVKLFFVVVKVRCFGKNEKKIPIEINSFIIQCLKWIISIKI